MGRLCLLFAAKADEGTRQYVEEIAAKYGLKGCHDIRISRSSPPYICGLIHPVLVLPEDNARPEGHAQSEGNTRPEEPVIVHELLHRKWKDVAVNVLLHMIRVVNWFNPVIWFLTGVVQNDGETLCDQRVLECYSEEMEKDYGEMLLAMTRGRRRNPVKAGTSNMAGSYRNMRTRIRRISDFHRVPTGIGFVVSCITLILAAAGVSASTEAQGYAIHAIETEGELQKELLKAQLYHARTPEEAVWFFLRAAALAFPISIESIFSLIPSSETISPEIMQTSEPMVNTGIPALNQAVNPVISASFAPSPTDSANPLQIWIPVCSILWIGGMVCLLSYAVISYWRLRGRVAEAVPVGENIYQCERVDSPFVLGIIRPRIYLPFGLCGQTGQVGAEALWPLSAMIAHEQAHIRRRDHWWKPLGFLLLTLYWFHPLVWIAYILLCRDIELACDEKGIRELDNGQRADYSQALLACSVSRKGISVCPLAFGEAGVKERVKSVLNYRRPAFWLIAVAVAVCGAVALCFLTDPAGSREAMTWVRGLSADQVISADLVVFSQTPEKQFMRLSEEEIFAMVDLINQSKGRYLEEHENLNGGGIFFYLTLQDGSTHSVGNIGNTYLFIDGDYYQAKYNWLSTWEETFGEGNAPLPEGYFSGQVTSGQTTSGLVIPGDSGNNAVPSGSEGSAAGEPH